MSGKEDYPLRDYYRDIHATYDRVNRIFTFGRDVAWRRKAVEACLSGNPEHVLDVCTGTGDFILEVARTTGRGSAAKELKGYDFSGAMIREAEQKLAWLQKEEGIQTVEFIEGEVGSMPFEQDHFDAMGITFGIRNLVYENSNAKQHLKEIYRVLKPGGTFVVLESSRPESNIWRLFNSLYLQLILPYLGGIISGNLKAYRYLARSSRNYYSISQMAAILEETGFNISNSQSLFLGSVMLLVAEK